jgi:hypothetical protein
VQGEISNQSTQVFFLSTYTIQKEVEEKKSSMMAQELLKQLSLLQHVK